MPPKSNHNSDGDPSREQAQENSKPEDDGPACQSCRRKKARCSRSQPCDQCTRYNISCVYDDRRMKPGLRAGAVDQLYRRIETLENMFLGQEMLWQQMWQVLHPNKTFPESTGQSTTIAELDQRREQMRESLLQSASGSKSSVEQNFSDKDTEGLEPASRVTKRRRLDKPDPDSPNITHDLASDPSGLLPPEIMTELVDFYYVNIHHWIPILHVTKFRERMKSETELPRITCILHAIIAVCVRFCQHERLPDEETKSRIAERSRQKVILDSTESFSVENLQALVIVAFETIGRGRGPSSWSIIGSMVGVVEQLQLSVEEDDLYRVSNTGEILIRRMVFLTPSKSWHEAEERRRVFWAVFLMDRFCSVSTGWKTSLNSADMKRRLPCEGAHWEKEREVCTPYFGIPDFKDTTSTSSILSENRDSANPEDQDSIGGLAYNIEATESLALVTNFFLRHAFIVDDTEKAQMWMMKFKELDLRLIQWKLYLPPKWREASVLNGDGVMDPNLTLAHITHNTAVILLHQGIAYPPPHWKICAVKPPSASSAETCLEAASEIARIGQQFLSHSHIFTNPQFSFCLFIAGRMLLAHAKYYQVAMPSALGTLTASLLEISERWKGRSGSYDIQNDNLAASFAKRLIEAQNNVPAAPVPSLDIRQTAYSDESKEQLQPSFTSTSRCEVDTFPSRSKEALSPAGYMSRAYMQDSYNDDPLSLAYPPLPLAFQPGFPASDGLSNFTQAIDGQAPSPLGLQSFHTQQMNQWQAASLPFVTGAQDELSYVFNFTPSPGQRISRYDGTHADSHVPILSPQGSNIPGNGR
ncbi:uncharacterized protein N7482_000155 [Penicillium canariense]|uniref:Zn(2)-C6 fungal-type domain-containing protein n=1 Tax=Penicillium canariense TaxID=189055 RepID=A0A9W9IAW6_9EURO|nr:uncharacterized protein N7482_000155 [Penicillium canariense]KAJ5174278.1 hypothetical protein N7482_000155 [Penicillium canariense]